MFFIQIVRGLIQKQYVRRFQEKLAKKQWKDVSLDPTVIADQALSDPITVKG